ncbi:DUF2500 domain-containing protein [Paenibacillus ginsengarvi]|uniref:DUF2500 domain-containing protein n=1 Tax=Paenibacillus ginsengarvi TaxID=400777 RepID=A0A3B0C855_9BACL|nr:DUF2500 domain-containing protein [Paenibacillus ginsengarvi]RKN82225.1 DUF2500 domain-containing protein [Paenibacillus ginsengarvi]
MFDIGPFGYGGGIFSAVPIIFLLVFAIVIFGLIRNVKRYYNNASAPRESVFARVVAKRMEVRNHTTHHHNANGVMQPVHSSRTYYYITLEFDGGERKEYLDTKNLFGLVVEGDQGYAAVQGEWIVAFERAI